LANFSTLFQNSLQRNNIDLRIVNNVHGENFFLCVDESFLCENTISNNRLG